MSVAAPVSLLQLPSTNEMAPGAALPRAFDGPPPITGDEPVSATFADVLSGAVGQVAEIGHQAHGRSVDLAEGRVDDLHGTMIATKKADISLHLIGSVRNKVLDAFHELWRMNV
jgi:flagellar hook-basal body complex protein FliE